jgi:colanic acid biosynthesis glycosyl transferase WcaI
MTKLIILNRYFAPDESATGRMASSLAFGLADRGWDVHAVASRQLYGVPGARLPPRQVLRGVVLHRLWTSRFGRHSLVGRVIDYITFYTSVLCWLLCFTRPGDLLIVATDPPLLSVVAWVAAAFTRASRINWLHDLYPEVAKVLGVLGPHSRYRWCLWLRDRSLVSASANVAIGQKMADYLQRRAIPMTRIHIIHNWADGTDVSPIRSELNPLRQRWRFDGKFVVGYSGNLGRAHEFQTVLRAAEALRENSNVAFLFIGAGHHLSWIRSYVDALALPNVFLEPYQPVDLLGQSLSVPDLHLVSLQPELEGLMVPSKFYGVAAAGRPTLYIGDVTGEIPTILGDADCGCSIAVGDVDGLVSWILRLRDSPEHTERWCRNARDVFSRRFDRNHALDRWCALLNNVIATPVIGARLLVGTRD